MSWHFIERWLQKVNQHSTLIGKFWITFLIVFRIVVVSSIGDRVYSDEQSEFKCNTGQPGCGNVCFNQFSPISHIRFWSFQIIMVCTPSVMYMVYSAHHTKKKGGKEKGSSHNNSPVSPEKTRKAEMGAGAPGSQWKNCPSDEDNNRKKSKRKKSQLENSAMPQEPTKKSKKKDSNEDGNSAIGAHRKLYALTVLLRTGIEVVFIFLQYKLFGLKISSLYKCEAFPCPNIVDCFVSRPMEKTIFLWFMLIIAIISFALNIVEMYYLLTQWLCKGGRNTCCQSRRTRYPSDLGDITIHDATIVDSGIVQPRMPPPPGYRGFGNDNFDGQDQYPPPSVDFLKHPMAINVSLNDPIIADHMSGGQPTSKLMAPSAPPRGGEFIMSNPSLDQGYPNLKRFDNRNDRNSKKGNDYNDYV